MDIGNKAGRLLAKVANISNMRDYVNEGYTVEEAAKLAYPGSGTDEHQYYVKLFKGQVRKPYLKKASWFKSAKDKDKDKLTALEKMDKAQIELDYFKPKKPDYSKAKTWQDSVNAEIKADSLNFAKQDSLRKEISDSQYQYDKETYGKIIAQLRKKLGF